MANDNEWGADPAKYKRLSKPFENEERAKVAVNAFMAEVSQLREKYRVAELTIQFQVYVLSPEKEKMYMTGGAGWGNQGIQAELAKKMFDREFDHLCVVAGVLAAKMPGVRRMLLTDPQPSATDDVTEREAETQ